MISYTTGNEHSPTQLSGRIALTIGDDGAAKLDHWSMFDGHAAWTGDVDPAVVESLRAALSRAGFPDAPRRDLIPDEATHRLEVDGAFAELADGVARQSDDYREAFAILGSL